LFELEDLSLIEGLKSGNAEAIEIIYNQSFPKVKSLILKNSGSESDAYDVFQEALELVLLKIDTFNINLEGMLILISKRKWIDRLRKQKTKENYKLNSSLNYEMEEDAEQKLIAKEKEFLRTKLLEDSFQQLSEICKTLMSLVKTGMEVDRIVKQMNFSSANTMYRRKAACMKRWSELLKQDGQYQQYFE